MTSTAYDRLLDALHQHGSKIIGNGVVSTAQCPAHDDRNPSLSLRSIEGQALLLCHAGCDSRDVLDALGLNLRDLYDEPKGATYRYDDGRVVHRSPAKEFRQTGHTKGSPATLYRAERVRQAVADEVNVYVVEGEKDVHAIEAVGAVATCAPMGAGKWHLADTSPLHGGKVIVVADRDDPGFAHARDVADSLDGMVALLGVVAAKDGKDAADHIAAGYGLTDFVPLDLDNPSDHEAANGADPVLGRVLRRSELANLPPLTPLVKGLLDYPSAAVLVGAYGIGKTFLVIALACSVATGRSWLGQPVERRKVLMVVGEGGSGLDKRIAAWEQGYNRGDPVGDDDLVVMVQPQSLSRKEVWQRIAERCAAEGIGFVILDTFSSLAPDADETKDAALMLRQMHGLATGISGTVLLVHHPGWSDNGRSRGGYQFEANADVVLLLTGTPDDPGMQLRRKKVKDGENGQVFWMRRETYALSGDHLGESSVVLRSINPAEADVPVVERIKVVLAGCGDVGATGPQVMEELGDVARSTFFKALSKATADGAVEAHGKGNRQRYFLAGKGG